MSSENKTPETQPTDQSSQPTDAADSSAPPATDTTSSSSNPATDTDSTTSTASDPEPSTAPDASEPQTERAPSTDNLTPAQTFTASIEAQQFEHVVGLARALVDEARLQLDSTDGLALRAVDKANVGFVDLTLLPDTFASFETDGGVLGIDLEQLETILTLADAGDLVQIALDAETRRLTIHLGGLEYILGLLDPRTVREPPERPTLDLPARVQLDYATFAQAIKAAKLVSDHLSLRVVPATKQFVAAASGDTDDVELVRTAEDLPNMTVGEADSLFSLDYLKRFRRALPPDTELTLHLGEDHPVIIDCTLADGTCTVQYMLAPRITADRAQDDTETS